jgi:AraC-like DNA-binding protein
MDVLSETLQMLQLSGSLIARADLRAPWGLELPQMKEVVFHIAVRGTCGLWREGDNSALWLGAGDLAILPHGDHHVLKDSERSAVAENPEVTGAGSCCPMLRIHGDGADTELVCGKFHLDRPEIQPLLSFLPPVIHLRAGNRHADAWLDATLKLIAEETATPQPGRDALINRMLGVLFIQAIRSYIAGLPPEHKSWFSALKDPVVGAALEVIHSSPGKPKTLEILASEVGVSRSELASRFKDRVGESPVSYMTRWRMQVAARLLEEEQLTVSQVAVRLGYEFEATFSRAFKRVVGIPPASYRRRRTQATP